MSSSQKPVKSNRKVAGKQVIGKETAWIKHGYAVVPVVLITLVITTILMGFTLFNPQESSPTVYIATPAGVVLTGATQAGPTVSASDLSSNISIINSPKYVVGIVSGHEGYDPGAVCDDGLTEVKINHAVAAEVVSLLKRRNIQADLLNEFDDLLSGYQADALVSIHADSCNIPGASGFKVARVTDSAIPEAEDRLVECLNQEYGRYTGLPQHPSSITDNMTNYHAFREIDYRTPGAIIEIGFLLDDRYLLEQKPKIVARGIAAGILCFFGE
jgi:N-acetylmuramoyl-L-alanine amidase